MHFYSKIALTGLLVIAVSGCDLIRSIAGRPTSEELSEKAVPKSTPPQREPADSLNSIGEAADTLPATPVQKTLYGIRVSDISQKATGLQNRYYVLIGTFSNPAYAKEQVRKAEAAGYSVQTIPFSEGRRTAVAVFHTDSLSLAVEGLSKVREEAFCPSDAYILLAE